MATTKSSSWALSWKFVKEAWAFLMHNKGLLIFPVLSLICTLCLFILGIFIVFEDLPILQDLLQQHTIAAIIGLVILYFVFSFIIILFNSALIATTTLRLKGEPATIGDGFRLAFSKFGKILGWSLIATTVGLLLSALENSHNVFEKIIGALLSFGWSVATYFVIPILVMEDLGPIAAIKRSGHIFGRGWKKVISVNALLILIFIPIIAIFAFLFHVLPDEKQIIQDYAFIIFIGFAIFASIVLTSFNAILTGALYLSIIKQQTPAGFDQALLSQAFSRKKQKSSPSF